MASENNIDGKDEHKDDAGSDSEDEKKLQKGNYLTLALSRSDDMAGLIRELKCLYRRCEFLREMQRRSRSSRIIYEHPIRGFTPKTSHTLLPPVPPLPNEPSLPTWFSSGVPSYDSTAPFDPLSSLPLNGPITGSLTSVQIKAPLRQQSTGTKTDPKCAAAGEALRKYRSLLHEGIADPEGLASSLYSENIICRETLDQVRLDNTLRKKNLILLDAVESRVRTNPSDFSKFCTTLRSNPHLRVFADELETCHSGILIEQLCQETEYSKHGVSSDGRRGVSSVDSERGVSSDSGHGISSDSECGFFSGIRRGIRKLFGAAKDATVSVVKKALRVFNLDIKIDRKYKKRFDKYTNREQTRWWFEVWGDESALKALESKWEEVYAQHKWRLETCPTVPKRS